MLAILFLLVLLPSGHPRLGVALTMTCLLATLTDYRRGNIWRENGFHVVSILTAVGQDFSGIIQAWALLIYFAFAGLRYHSVYSPQTLKQEGRSQHIRQRHRLLPGGAPALTNVCPALPRAKTLLPAAIAATSALLSTNH